MVHCPMKDSFCEALQLMSSDTWSLLEDSKIYGAPIGEETITQLNCLRLNKNFGQITKTLQLTKQEEKKDGADWLWVFYDRRYWRSFTVAVQAKRLWEPENQYGAFKKGQVDKLLNYARRENAVPLYAFYNHHGLIDRLTKRNFPLDTFLKYLLSPQGLTANLGCTVCHAAEVHKISNTHAKKPEKLFSKMKPWWAPACRCGQVDPMFQIFPEINPLFRLSSALQPNADDDSFGEFDLRYIEPSGISPLLKAWITNELDNISELRSLFSSEDKKYPLFSHITAIEVVQHD